MSVSNTLKARIKAILRNDPITNVSLTSIDDFFCEECPSGKQCKLPFSKNKGKNRTVVPGEIVYCDLCCLMQMSSVSSPRFFFTL